MRMRRNASPANTPRAGARRIAIMSSPREKTRHDAVPVVDRSPAHPQRTTGPTDEKPGLRDGWAVYFAQVASLAAVYFGAAKVGLTMATVAEQVTAVWPPTGIALAALLLCGLRFWPGVALGAFAANATAHAPLATAAA